MCDRIKLCKTHIEQASTQFARIKCHSYEASLLYKRNLRMLMMAISAFKNFPYGRLVTDPFKIE